VTQESARLIELEEHANPETESGYESGNAILSEKAREDEHYREPGETGPGIRG